MPLDIGALLGSYSAGTKALLAAAGLPQQLYADAPSQNGTGGTPAPAAAQAVAATSPQTAAQYLAAASRYATGKHASQDFLGGPQMRGRLGFGGRRPAPQLELTPGAQVYDLGGGKTAHVYIDPKTGKRSVQVF
jgi:hypothetical protein